MEIFDFVLFQVEFNCNVYKNGIKKYTLENLNIHK